MVLQKWLPLDGKEEKAITALQVAGWLDFDNDDLRHSSEIRETYGMFIDWWRECKDEKEWTNIIKKVVEMHT